MSRYLGNVWDATERYAYVKLITKVSPYQLVVIKDGNRYILGVVGSIKVKDTTVDPTRGGVEPWIYAEVNTEQPIIAYVQFLYEVRDNNIVQEVQYPPDIGSGVYEVGGDLFGKVIGALYVEPLHIGSLRNSTLPFYLEGKYLPYHIGIFGATGTGKSKLAVVLAREAKKKGYKVIAFDHSGMDYVPYLDGEVVESSRIKIPADTIGTVLAKLAGVYNNKAESYHLAITIAADLYTKVLEGTYTDNYLKQLVKDIKDTSKLKILVERISKVGRYDPSIFIELSQYVASIISRTDVSVRLGIYMNKPSVRRFIESLNNRVLDPNTLIGKNVIIDLSTDVELDVKQSIVHQILDALWYKKLYEGDESRYLIIVDEAQNYASHYWENSVCYELLNKTAREGRKYNICLMLISQKYKDIDTSIRNNLNTLFIGRMYNIWEVEEILPRKGISEYLTTLGNREFVVHGVANPLRQPVVIRTKDIQIIH